MRGFAPLALALAAAGLPAGRAVAADETKVAEGDGYAVVADGDAAAARQRARDLALRSCVQQVGSAQGPPSPGPGSEPEDAPRLAERVYARAETYVRGYEVLEDRQEGNVWVARLRCKVAEARLAADLAAPATVDAGPATAAGPAAERQVALKVSGAGDFARLASFQKQLETLPGVRSVRLKSLEDGRAALDVRVAGSGDTLAAELVARTFPGLGVRVVRQAPDAVEVELSGARDR